MNIIKLNPRAWNGTGFGYAGAVYGVEGREDIRIKRESGLWIAYIPGVFRLAEDSKAELEKALSVAAA